MYCNEADKEDLQTRLTNYTYFKEPWKQNLKQSSTEWCKNCRKQYKYDTCEQVSIDAKSTKKQLPGHTYKDDVETLKQECEDMLKSINSLRKNHKDMNLSYLELEKEELLQKSKRFVNTLQGCFNDRKTYSNNCIFDKNTNKQSTDIGHLGVENNLQNSINFCNSVYDLTSDDNKWKNKIESIYGKTYPTDNVYKKSISPKRSKRKTSSRGKKTTVKKTGKNKGKMITKRRMISKRKK